MNTKADREEQLVLELLEAVGQKNDVSQRHLASHMGVALGLANSYLKRCIRKGFIKISEAPANRYLYYLTPTGFAEKSRITAKYLSSSFAFYRKAGESCIRTLETCEQNGWRRIVLCGISDLGEIVALRALECGVEIIGTYDPHTDRRRFVNKPVWQKFSDVLPCDAWLLTDLNAPRVTRDHIVSLVSRTKVLVPDILRLE
ncbi:MAG TPA: winged helix-turn-helix transcriptional regulator [Burkholderiales bacterium]|nr:winged helix-turn-helix transcriptional regulator [Burkholderiales bacterium]